MEEVVQAIQLPQDSTGKITGGFLLKGKSVAQATVGDGSDIWLPATVIVDENGTEIGGKILKELETIALMLGRIEDLQILATAALTE